MSSEDLGLLLSQGLGLRGEKKKKKVRFGAGLENGLSWVSQSKLTVDLDTGVYLRADEMRAFTLLD